MKSAVIALLAVFLGISLTMNFLEFKRYSTRRPIMLIGGEPITLKEYQDQLDFKYGKTVLNKLAYMKLVRWAATKDGVTPTEKDVDARIAQMERREPRLLAAAKQDPNKMAELRDDLWTDIALENIRIKGITVSDADVAAFYQKHKAAFGLPTQVKTAIAVAGNAVDASTAAELFKQNMSPDLIARQPRIRVVGVGGYALPGKLPPALTARLNQTVYKMKMGDVATVPAGNAFLVLHVIGISPASVPPLDQIKPFVTRLDKLQKAPTAGDTIAKLYSDAHVTFEMDKYEPYFSEIEQRVQKIGLGMPPVPTKQPGK